MFFSVLLERELYIRDLLRILAVDADVSLGEFVWNEKAHSFLGDGERAGIRFVGIEMNIVHRILILHGYTRVRDQLVVVGGQEGKKSTHHS